MDADLLYIAVTAGFFLLSVWFASKLDGL